MMNWNGHHASGWGVLAMSAGAILGLALALGAVFLASRIIGRTIDRVRPWPAAAMATPQRCLAERFARGEIDEEDYRQCLAVLQTTAPAPNPTRAR